MMTFWQLSYIEVYQTTKKPFRNQYFFLMFALQCTLQYTLQCIVQFTVQCTLQYRVQCIFMCTVYNVQCTVYSKYRDHLCQCYFQPKRLCLCKGKDRFRETKICYQLLKRESLSIVFLDKETVSANSIFSQRNCLCQQYFQPKKLSLSVVFLAKENVFANRHSINLNQRS